MHVKFSSEIYLQEEDFPTVLIGLFIEQPTPFLKSFFEKVVELDYPKQKIDLLIHNSVSSRILKTKKLICFIPSSESNAYLKQIKVILSAVKKYRIFSLVTNTIYIFHCSKQRLFRQFRA